MGNRMLHNSANPFVLGWLTKRPCNARPFYPQGKAIPLLPHLNNIQSPIRRQCYVTLPVKNSRKQGNAYSKD
jgi:hypothetical protein